MTVRAILLGVVLVWVAGCNDGDGSTNDNPGDTATGWISRGHGGGGAFYAVSISPHDPDEAYCSTDMGAQFHTTDFGVTWAHVDFHQYRGGHDTQVRFTSDPDIRYGVRYAYGTDARHPCVSTDGGQTWSDTAADPTGGEAYTLWADPGSTARLLTADYNNLYFSNDSGQTWATAYAGSALHIGGAFWDGQTILVGTRAGLVVSTDGGASFALDGTAGLPAGDGIVSMAGAKEGPTVRLFAVTAPTGDIWPGVTGGEYGTTTGVYALDWGGASWAATGALPTNTHAFFVDMPRGDIDTVYVAGCDTAMWAPGVSKSTDGGTTWTLTLQGNQNQTVQTGPAGHGGDFPWGYGEYALGFGVCPTDADRLIVTDMGFAYKSSSGGASWQAACVNPADLNPAGSMTPQGRSYRGNGLEDTSGWGLHWVDGDTILAAYTDIRGIRSADGGTSWRAGTSLGLPHNTTYCIVEAPNGTLYGATSTVHDLYESTYLQDARIDGGDGSVITSADGGLTWTTLHDFNHPVVWLALDPGNSEVMLASVAHSTEGDIYRTQDLSSGTSATWARLAVPTRTEGHPYVARVLDDGTYVCSYSGRRDAGGAFTLSSGVFVSTDGGASWADRSHADMQRWTKDIVVDPHDGDQDTWYACVFSHWGAYPNEVGGIFRTADRGLTWARISDLYRVESLTVDPADADHAWATTETRGLWETADLSSATPTFTAVADFPFLHPMRVFVNPFDATETWVTTFGGGLFVKRR